MATRSRKSQVATQPVQEEITTIEQALDTRIERTLEDAADYSNR
jgi:sensor domain CHASE-containing protein